MLGQMGLSQDGYFTSSEIGWLQALGAKQITIVYLIAASASSAAASFRLRPAMSHPRASKTLAGSLARIGVAQIYSEIPTTISSSGKLLREENSSTPSTFKNYCLACSDVTSGSPLLILPSQTAATVEMLMISVLPQTEHLHRKANGLTSTTQLQLVSGCFIGAPPCEPWVRRMAQRGAEFRAQPTPAHPARNKRPRANSF
jgi:hypothetical protein